MDTVIYSIAELNSFLTDQIDLTDPEVFDFFTILEQIPDLRVFRAAINSLVSGEISVSNFEDVLGDVEDIFSEFQHQEPFGFVKPLTIQAMAAKLFPSELDSPGIVGINTQRVSDIAENMAAYLESEDNIHIDQKNVPVNTGEYEYYGMEYRKLLRKYLAAIKKYSITKDSTMTDSIIAMGHELSRLTKTDSSFSNYQEVVNE